MVSRDERYQNAMRNSDEQSARMESDRALLQVILGIMGDNIELFKQLQGKLLFKKWLSDLVFDLTYNKEGKPYDPPENTAEWIFVIKGDNLSIATLSSQLQNKRDNLANMSKKRSDAQTKVSQETKSEANAQTALAKARSLSQLRSRQRTLESATAKKVKAQRDLSEVEKQYARLEKRLPT